jgi:hypothetical protein
MPTEIEALRATMKAAQASGKGQYIEAGRHLLEVDRCFVKRSQQSGTIKESWICEFKVIESSNPTHEVGSTRSYVENPANKGWLERWKSFMLAAIGVDPSATPTPAGADDAVADMFVALRYDEARVSMQLPDNFLKGKRVACEGMAGKSLSGGPVTNKKWTPAPPPAGGGT